MAECTCLADSCDKVIAIGINCTAPRFIHNLINSIKKVPNCTVILFLFLFGMKLDVQFRRNRSLAQNLIPYWS